MLQSLTKCSCARRVTAGLAFGSAAHASRRSYATPANRNIINLKECASLDFYPPEAPIPFALTFRLVVSSISVDRCGDREPLRRRNLYKIRSFRMVANLKVQRRNGDEDKSVRHIPPIPPFTKSLSLLRPVEGRVYHLAAH